VAESAVYTAGLSLHQPRVLASVDRFVAPSRYAAGQLALLGLPAERIEVLRHYLPAESLAEESAAGAGEYALVAARLSPEKGIDVAIDAAAAAGVPLRIAGEGPEEAALRARARRIGAPVEFLGRVPREGMAGLLAGAAMVLLPSRYHEFAPYSALEAMAAGVPVLASALGGLPEMVGADLPPGDSAALAERMRGLWRDPGLRLSQGAQLLGRVRADYSEEGFVERLLALYAEVTQ
jgi:glycosyltransferase involved in cell wall biosynthesis